MTSKTAHSQSLHSPSPGGEATDPRWPGLEQEPPPSGYRGPGDAPLPLNLILRRTSGMSFCYRPSPSVHSCQPALGLWGSCSRGAGSLTVCLREALSFLIPAARSQESQGCACQLDARCVAIPGPSGLRLGVDVVAEHKPMGRAAAAALGTQGPSSHPQGPTGGPGGPAGFSP